MATYALTGVIKFPEHKGRAGFEIRRFGDCEIHSSWKSLTNTAKIELPRNVPDFDKEKPSKWFRVGDPVEIWLGYDGIDLLEFTGYLSEVDIGIPINLHCQDEMYQLKQDTISIATPVNYSLKELLQKIAPKHEIVCDKTQLIGKVRFENLTPANCLDELKKQGISCFFIGDKLHAMDNTNRLNGNTYKFLIERTASDGRQDIKLKKIENVKVTIEKNNRIGKKTKVSHGDEKATIVINRTISGLDISKEEMENSAKKIYTRAKMPGLVGDIKLFGVPSIKLGDKIQLSSTVYKNRPEFYEDKKKYSYEVDSITKRFSTSEPSYRQICTLGDRVNESK